MNSDKIQAICISSFTCTFQVLFDFYTNLSCHINNDFCFRFKQYLTIFMKKIFTLQQALCCLMLFAIAGAFSQNLTDDTGIKAKVMKNMSCITIPASYLKEAHIISAYCEKPTGKADCYRKKN